MGTAERVWNSSREELERVQGITPKLSRVILEEKAAIQVDKNWREIVDKGMRVITFHGEGYPESLRHIHAPPALLYIKGEPFSPKEKRIGVVGTRKCTPYGRKIVQEISKALAEQGFTVVSGMALGIDTLAHWSTLKAGGRTIAVLGCGLDVMYPRQNQGLAEDIVKNGTLVSEFPPGTSPLPRNFPMRNRIISGLSSGVVVVEAAEKSGALITADCALEQGREVFAVPGNIDSPYSRGCNRLIKEGAVLLQDPMDIFVELGYDVICESAPQESPHLTNQEKDLFKWIQAQPVHVDLLRDLSGLSAGTLNSMLTILELKGIIKQLPGKYFVKK